MAHLSERLARNMAKSLHKDLEQYLRTRSNITAVPAAELSTPGPGDPPADVVLPMGFLGASDGSIQGRLYVSYLKPGVYQVAVQVEGSPHRTRVLDRPETNHADPLPGTAMDALWKFVLQQVESAAQSERPQPAAA